MRIMTLIGTLIFATQTNAWTTRYECRSNGEEATLTVKDTFLSEHKMELIRDDSNKESMKLTDSFRNDEGHHCVTKQDRLLLWETKHTFCLSDKLFAGDEKGELYIHKHRSGGFMIPINDRYLSKYDCVAK